MKHLFLFIVFIFFVTTLQTRAQEITATLAGTGSGYGFSVNNSGSTTLFRVRGDGNVGIGTTSPNAILHTYATISQNPPILERSWTTGGHGELLNLSFTTTSDNATAGDGGIMSFIGEDNNGNQVKYAEVVATIEDPTDGDEDGALSFRTLEGGTRTEQLRITSAGDVGIGNTNPTFKLDVAGDVNIDDGQVYRINAQQVLSIKGNKNTFVGQDAGYTNSTGKSNTFIGSFAGYDNTSGQDNTFIGTWAGLTNTTGGGNNFIGYMAGFNNIDGHGNTFSGNSAGMSNEDGNSNTFYGGSAGYYNTSGDFNSFIGGSAGNNNTTGSSNTYIGYLAGNLNSTGSGNVFLGYLVGFSETGSDKLYIDNSNTSSPLIYGDFSTDDVQINGDLCYTGTFGGCSDKRYKKNVKPITNALQNLLMINGVYFDWRKEEFSEMVFADGKQIGIIAQEVETVYPEIVNTDKNGYKTLDYSKLSVILLQAIKEQQLVIEEQSGKIEEMNQRLEAIEEIIANEEIVSR